MQMIAMYTLLCKAQIEPVLWPKRNTHCRVLSPQYLAKNVEPNLK